MGTTRREFLKQLGAIAASMRLEPEQLMQADTVVNALRAITTGDLAGLASLTSQRQATVALQEKTKGGLLRHVNVPPAFLGEPGDNDEKRAARYIASLATREEILHVVIDAQAHENAQGIVLNNLSGGFTQAINGFLKADSAFAHAVHQLSCKLGKLAMDEFRRTYTEEKLTLSTLEEMRAKYPDREFHPDDCAFITEHHAMAKRFIGMDDGKTSLQDMQEAVTYTYRLFSDQQMQFSEIVDNMFGIENINYADKPPINTALQAQMQQWVDELMEHTDCSTIGAGQKRLITNLLKDHTFWTAVKNEHWNLFTHAGSHAGMEVSLMHNIEELLGDETRQRVWNLITLNDFVGQFQFRADVLDGLSRHPDLPLEYREELAQQAQAERRYIRPDDPSEQAGHTPQTHDEPQPPRPAHIQPYISADSQRVYAAVLTPTAFARDHSWFERLLDEKNHAKPLDHLKTASR